jgi:hypothetical protein
MGRTEPALAAGRSARRSGLRLIPLSEAETITNIFSNRFSLNLFLGWIKGKVALQEESNAKENLYR